jgi:putative membrane protein insertion efficiency factor|tara:strand:+ start:122 stop:337 length:216 start_codon:yes stop_codon:yes gene_type:complete
MKYILIKIIRIYQVIFSVFVGQHCRFTPTCSNYAIDAVENHGFLKGLILSTKRVCRCHPWAAGGVDEVPKK